MTRFTWVIPDRRGRTNLLQIPQVPQPDKGGPGKILVFGATGTLGFTVCECLATAKIPFLAAYKTGTRNRDNVDELRKLQTSVGNHVMQMMEIDWDQPNSVRQALQGIERVFLKVPIGHVDGGALTFSQLISNHPTLKYICYMSFLDASRELPTQPKKEPHLLEIPSHALGWESYWGEQRIQNFPGISWSIVRPSFLFSNLLFDIPTIKSKGEILRPLKDCSVNIVSDVDVAQVICYLLTQLVVQHANGHIYHLTGPSLYTFSDVAKILSQEIGKSIQYVDISEDEFRILLADSGFDRLGIENYVSSHGFMKQGGYSVVYDDINNLLDVKPRSLQEMFRENINLFKSEQ